jgi:hypothetical protein
MHQAFNDLYLEYSRQLDGIEVATAQLRPPGGDGQWSTQDVIAHLILTYSSTSGMLQSRLAKGRASQRRNTVAQPFIKLTVLSLGIMPKGFSAPERVRPQHAGFAPMNGKGLAARLCEDLRIMDELLDECQQRFGSGRVASHFLLGPLRVDQWRRFHVVHGRHHLRQLVRIRKQIESVAQESGSIAASSPR